MKIATSKLLLLLISLPFVLLLTFFVFQKTRYKNNLTASEITHIKQNLVNEFNNAYTEQVTETGNIVEIDLQASIEKINVLGTEQNLFTYNGQVPGPTIKAKVGDTVKVNFKNNLPQETTIHWHGLRVENSMDGVPGVTQDPIKPGEDFVYEFVVKDAGTFWYHPHVRSSEQVEKGLYGTIIVEDPEHDSKDDLILVLDDWLINNNGILNKNFNTRHDVMHDGRWGNVITINSKLNPSISLAPNESKIIRIVNTSNGRTYNLDFLDLDVTVMAADGLKVQIPFKYTNFFLSPGNRIDLLITTPQDFKETVQIKDVFSKEQANILKFIVDENKNIENKNIAKTTDETNVEETIKLTKEQILSTYKLGVVPNWEDAHKLPIDKTYKLNSSGHMMNLKWQINGKSFPSYDKDTFNKGEFYKIKFSNASSRLHPMHLHGQFFKVISRNGRPVNENYFRDTILVLPNENIELGIIPLDSGIWANHCHILEHAEAGMMTFFEVT